MPNRREEPVVFRRRYRHRSTGEIVETQRFYGRVSRWRDGRETRPTVALLRDRQASIARLLQLQKQADREHAGYSTAAERLAEQPIGLHVDAYERHLSARGVSERHLEQELTKLRKLIGLPLPKHERGRPAVSKGLTPCGFRRLLDVTADRVADYLDAITAAGAAPKTRNDYLATVRAFVRWCVPERLPADPLTKLSRAADREPTKHRRRALTAEEGRRLIAAALRRPVDRGRFVVELDGRPATDEDRARLGVEHALLWKLLILTGIRSGELRQVTWADVDLAGGWITIRASVSKTGVRRDVALRKDLARELAVVKRLRRSDGLQSPLAAMPGNVVRALRKDLAAAGIPYLDGDRFADVHAMRHTCNSWLLLAGVPERVVRQQLGHAERGSMTTRYLDVRLLDLHAAVEALPSLPPVIRPKSVDRICAGFGGHSWQSASAYGAKREREKKAPAVA